MQYTDLGLPILISSGAGGARTRLSGNTTYYIRTDGNDSNSGTTNTSGGAWLTLQHAIDSIVANLDFANYTVTIQIGDGSYAASTTMTSGWTGGGALTIQGNATTPTNVVLSATNANVLNIECSLPGVLTIQHLQITTSGGGGGDEGVGINHNGAGQVLISGIDCAATAWYHFATGTGASIYVTGNYTISGGGGRAHFGAFQGGHIGLSNTTVTISNSPTFSFFVIASQCGSIQSLDCTFTGSVTCERYYAELNGVIHTDGGGATYFPGTSAGTSASGGQYD